MNVNTADIVLVFLVKYLKIQPKPTTYTPGRQRAIYKTRIKGYWKWVRKVTERWFSETSDWKKPEPFKQEMEKPKFSMKFSQYDYDS